jgi:hypothetical protein
MQSIIRLYKPEDFDDITRLWFEAEKVAMPKLMESMGHTLEDAREYFQRAVVAECQVWVYEQVAFRLDFAIQGDFLAACILTLPHRQGIGLCCQGTQTCPAHLFILAPPSKWRGHSMKEQLCR